MISEKQRRTSEYWYIFLTLLMATFCILKVLRGINTVSTQEGGIWNYISLVYYGVFAWGVVTIRRFQLKMVFVVLFIYSMFSMLFSLIVTPMTSLYTIYTYFMIPCVFLVMSSFYMYSTPSKKGDTIVILVYIACLGVNLYSIVRFMFMGANRAVASDVYYSLCLFPFVLVYVKNKALKNVLLWIQFFTIFLSNKRAGFLAFAVGIVLYYFITERSKGKENLIRFLKTLLTISVMIVVLITVSIYIDAQYEFGIYNRLMLLEVDQGSGRGNLYSTVWEGFRNSPLIEKLMGHGLNTAGKVGGAGYAHNDFLQALYDFGIPSALCLIVFYAAMIVEAIKMIIRKSPYAAAFVFSLVVGLMLSAFSYFLIYFTYVTCIAAFWGCILKKEKQRLEGKSVPITVHEET